MSRLKQHHARAGASGITRRGVLRRIASALAAAVTLALPQRLLAHVDAPGPHGAYLELRLKRVYPLEAAEQAGAAAATALPRADIGAFAARVGSDWTAINAMTDAQIRSQIETSARSDYRAGRIWSQDGWVISQTEAELLGVLLRKSEGAQV